MPKIHVERDGRKTNLIITHANGKQIKHFDVRKDDPILKFAELIEHPTRYNYSEMRFEEDNA